LRVISPGRNCRSARLFVAANLGMYKKRQISSRRFVIPSIYLLQLWQNFTHKISAFVPKALPQLQQTYAEDVNTSSALRHSSKQADHTWQLNSRIQIPEMRFPADLSLVPFDSGMGSSFKL
jgi:hypothetical protein